MLSYLNRTFLNCIIFACSLFTAAVTMSSMELGAEALTNKGNGRYFTVRDSIEMERFGQDGPIFSPNGRYFVVVTSRGIVQRNQIESTLRLFEAQALKEYWQGSKGKDFSSRIITRLAATPIAYYPGPYEPVISSVRWTRDSKSLLFLVQNSLGNRQLYEAEVSQARGKALTPPTQDVSQFDSVNGTIVYRVTQFEAPSPVGEKINADAQDITGMDLRTILFPDKRRPTGYSILWIRKHEKSHPVVNSATGQVTRLWDRPPVVWNTLSLAPNGESVVVLSPVTKIRPDWEHYEPTNEASTRTGRIHAQDFNPNTDSNHERLTQYAIISLVTGQTTPLVDAPNGYALGYGNENQVRWSSDGKKLLLLNTFLPFGSADNLEQGERVRPCAAAVIDLSQTATQCVVYRTVKPVNSSSFGQTDNEVVLQFGKDPLVKFYFEKDAWRQEEPSTAPGSYRVTSCDVPRQNLSTGVLVDVLQDLNEPPVLAATDCSTGRQERIWNPNPQLARMKLGEASIIHWKDVSGYEWRGLLIKPPDYTPGVRYPLVIEPYGFEEHEFVTDGEHTTAQASRPLAAAGIMVLQFWPRSDRAGTAEEAQQQIVGYEAAIEKLTSDGLVDPEKIGIIGFSRTCYHVESALVSNPTRFAAAAIADGVDESYMQSMLLLSLQRESEAIYGTKPIGPGLKKWIADAPGFNLDRMETPLRIEAIGPASILTEWEIYASLWTQQKPVDLIYIAGGQHTLQRPLDRMASQQGNVDWFRFWLKGEEDPDPAKATQYVRWRKLRAQYLANISSLKHAQ
jgi:dipeptidyl aminopeptidase/acylaminoacyl peptidase